MKQITYIERLIFYDLRLHLEKPEISLITGARQVGKTTLMLKLQEYVRAQGKQTLFLSLDFEEDKQFFESQRRLIERVQLEFGQSPGYVFIDEIQRQPDAGLFLKGIYDRGLPFKLVVSGSGSLELKEKIHESLAGRKAVFEVLPVSFAEFVNFKTEYRYASRLTEYFRLETAAAAGWLEEYLHFGGYPAVILGNSLADKKRTMNDIFTSYLEKDIAYLLKVNKTDDFSALLKLLAVDTGKLLNVSELAGELGISFPTVKKYLYYLEKTFTIKRLAPFTRNSRKEISKASVVYFADLGLRNYARGRFDDAAASDGFAFQNFIFNMLYEKYRQSPVTLHFWRTKDKAEVDFILSRGNAVVPLEVKYRSGHKANAGKSLYSFIERYRPTAAYVVARDAPPASTNLARDKRVRGLPYWRVWFDELIA